jgi:hypothetical protein
LNLSTLRSKTVSRNETSSISGRACAQSIFGWFTWGDAGAQTAARQAQIAYISSVDEEYFSVLAVYSRLCTRVSGLTKAQVKAKEEEERQRDREEAEKEALEQSETENLEAASPEEDQPSGAREKSDSHSSSVKKKKKQTRK